MTKFILSLFFVWSLPGTYAQQLSQVTFSEGANLSSFSFITDQKVVIRVSPEGKVIEWGTDPGIGRYKYYTGKLQPFTGRIEYYAATEYDSVLRGKVKSIGTCFLTYYGASETEVKIGKVKSIGLQQLDYIGYESIDNKGKLKSAGYTVFDYYPNSENESFRGKLKSVGNSAITWYSSFDDKKIMGKIKSIGTFNYTWYTSHDRYSGLKSGPQTQVINGVTYIVR
ncbi:MAG TPA: hypothetical protein VI461_01710 [Chitinophagaceae bacterium]|nr:hypothetical protein [Chitinophagaceae bacterium]